MRRKSGAMIEKNDACELQRHQSRERDCFADADSTDALARLLSPRFSDSPCYWGKSVLMDVEDKGKLNCNGSLKKLFYSFSVISEPARI